MKSLFSLIFLSVALSGMAQNFTNRTVYDYSVGDTIVTEFQKYKTNKIDGPPKYTYMMVYGKSTSLNLDTIHYNMHIVEYTPGSCFGCAATISTKNQDWVISDLDSSVVHYPILLGLCQKQKDTTYVGFCGSLEHLRFAKDTAACPEPPNRKIRFIQGIGMFEENTNLNGFPSEYGFITRPVSAHKVGKNCSVVGPVPNGISEFSKRNGVLKVYPSISAGEYTMETEHEGVLSVSNALGQNVLNSDVLQGKNKIDLTSQPAGIYFVMLKKEGFFQTGKIVKN